MISFNKAKRAIAAVVLSLLILGLISFTGSFTASSTRTAGQVPLTTLHVAYADDECDDPHPPPGLDCPPTPTATPTPSPGQ